MRSVTAFVLLCSLISPFAYGDDACGSKAACAANAVKHEVVRYVRDAKSLATAPLHWDRRTWERFGAGTAVVVALYATDRQISDRVAQNRSSTTDQFAKAMTPFGGHRA